MLSVSTRNLLGVISISKLYPYLAPFRKSSLAPLGSTEYNKSQQLLIMNLLKLPTSNSRVCGQSICGER